MFSNHVFKGRKKLKHARKFSLGTHCKHWNASSKPQLDRGRINLKNTLESRVPLVSCFWYENRSSAQNVAGGQQGQQRIVHPANQ